MPDWVTADGEPIETGSGGLSWMTAGGEPIQANNKIPWVTADGEGLGGLSGAVIMEGVDIGYYSTAESHTNWYNYSPGSDPPNARGFYNHGYFVDEGQHRTYVVVHENSDDGTYAIGIAHFESTDSSNNGSIEFDVSPLPSAANVSDPLVKDDPEDPDIGNDDRYSGSGDTGTANHGYGRQNGDGVVYQLGSSFEGTLTIEVQGTGWQGSPLPDGFTGVGPIDTTRKTLSTGSTFTVECKLG